MSIASFAAIFSHSEGCGPSVIRLTSFCEYGFSVFAFLCPLANLPSYLGFSYLGCGVSFHSCSSKAQPLLLTLDEVYLLTAALPDLQCGIAPLGPPAPAQPQLLGRGVGLPGHRPWPRSWDCSSPLALGLGLRGVG